MPDPITFQVIQSRLSGIVQEMQEHIFRTGYSTVIRESQDASCMILDASGDVVGEHVVLPLHVASLPEVVRAIIRSHGQDVAPGDAFITNDPYTSGVPHAMDMAVVTPVFYQDRLVAYCGSIAHKSDLGGVVPGTANANATDVFQEGIQFPVARIASRGKPVTDIESLLRANSRTPELVMGDIRGQVGVARLGERRLCEMFDRYGLAAALDVFEAVKDIAETRIRAELSTWPEGEFEAEAFLDETPTSGPVRFHVRIVKTGSAITFDFQGSDGQALGPVNIRPPLVRGCCYYALIAMIDPALANNGGIARVVETVFRAGSVVDPVYPGACNTYMPSATAVTEACLRALSGFVPERSMAGVGGFGAISLGGKRSDGTAFSQYDLGGSAYGGRTISDGPSGIAVLLSNARSAPIEVIESEFPTRIRRFELIRDSGGPGTFRGGLAARREFEILAPDVQATLRGNGHQFPAPGCGGGLPGRPARCDLNANRDDARTFPSRFGGLALRAGDILTVDRGGGGGFGRPQERRFESIVEDVINGYVSRDAAITDYGIDAQRLDSELTSWLGA